MPLDKYQLSNSCEIKLVIIAVFIFQNFILIYVEVILAMWVFVCENIKLKFDLLNLLLRY